MTEPSTRRSLRDLPGGDLAIRAFHTEFHSDGMPRKRELGYRLEFPGGTKPVFPPHAEPQASFRSVVGVELRYWLLRAIDALRSLLLRSGRLVAVMQLLASSPFFWVRSSVLASFLPPALKLERAAVRDPLVLQMSRRVLRLDAIGSGLRRQQILILHVLTESPDRSDVERLFSEFVAAVSRGEVPREVTGPHSSHVLISKRAARFARRSYWAVYVIDIGNTYGDLVAAKADASAWTDVWPRRLALPQLAAPLDMEPVDPVDPPRSVSDRAGVQGRFANPSAELASTRADRDWQLVEAAVVAATDQGMPLDDDFVERVARDRLDLARRDYRYTRKTGAGPTLDSSRSIVRDILELHMIADAADQGADLS